MMARALPETASILFAKFSLTTPSFSMDQIVEKMQRSFESTAR